jgi:hypothetical protein
MAGEVFYRNGIELPLTLELLAIFLLPIPAVLLGDEGRRKDDLGRLATANFCSSQALNMSAG